MKTLVRTESLNNIIWYKLIQLKSIRTLETINVGIVYISDKEHKSISFKMFEDIGYIEEAFPIFEKQYIETCKSILGVKLRLKMINNEEIKITRNIHISETKVYISCANDIEKEIFNRFVTIQTTKNYFSPLYKKYKELIDRRSKLSDSFFDTSKTKHEEIKLISLKNTNIDDISNLFKYIKKHKKRIIQ